MVAFSSRARILGECSTIHSPPTRFLYFLWVEISLCTLIPLFTPGLVHSGSASWDNCDWAFPDELHASLFPDRVPTLCLDSGMVSPLWFCWVKGVCMFRCNLPPALLAEWLGSFTCHCSNTGVGQTPNKSQHTKLTLDKKILPPLLPGFEFATFRLQVQRFNQQVTPAPVPLFILSYRHVQCYSTHWHLRSNLGDFNNRVCHVMKIIITESNPDVGL